MPIDPCGTVMDYLRSCYSTTARFKAGDPHTSVIKWYWAPDGADKFPDRHSFGSLNWSDGSGAGNVVGEVVGAPRLWSNGAAPDGVLGANFCGTVAEFQNGIDDFLPAPRPQWDNGLPTCCTIAILCSKNDPPDYGNQPFLDGAGFSHVGGFFGVDDFVWGRVAAGTIIGFSLHFEGDACNLYPTRGFLQHRDTSPPGPPYLKECELLSYDDATGTGVWRVPLDAPRVPGAIVSVVQILVL